MSEGYSVSCALQGWQCPICGAVYSPMIMACMNCTGWRATNNTGMMPDRDKVIKAIEGCVNDGSFCSKCDYDGCIFQHGSCEKDLLADALDLLKEQGSKTGHWNGPECSRCHAILEREWRFEYCPYCGAYMNNAEGR